jgi:hypothetical protein
MDQDIYKFDDADATEILLIYFLSVLKILGIGTTTKEADIDLTLFKNEKLRSLEAILLRNMQANGVKVRQTPILLC